MKNEDMQYVKKIFDKNPKIKQNIIQSNPLLSDLSGFSYGIEPEYPDEYQ